MLSNMLTMLGNWAAHACVNSITCFAVGADHAKEAWGRVKGSSDQVAGWLAGCGVGQGFRADDDQVISRAVNIYLSISIALESRVDLFKVWAWVSRGLPWCHVLEEVGTKGRLWTSITLLEIGMSMVQLEIWRNLSEMNSVISDITMFLDYVISIISCIHQACPNTLNRSETFRGAQQQVFGAGIRTCLMGPFSGNRKSGWLGQRGLVSSDRLGLQVPGCFRFKIC